MISDRDVVLTAVTMFARYLIAQGGHGDAASIGKAVHDFGNDSGVVKDGDDVKMYEDWQEHLYVYDVESGLGHRVADPMQLIQIKEVSKFLGPQSGQMS